VVEGALGLDDPRWAQLCARNSGAAWVPAWLRHVLAQPHDLARFNDEWPELSSECTTWSAAYAAMPYLDTRRRSSRRPMLAECIDRLDDAELCSHYAEALAGQSRDD
jgi:hypothetical protein